MMNDEIKIWTLRIFPNLTLSQNMGEISMVENKRGFGYIVNFRDTLTRKKQFMHLCENELKQIENENKVITNWEHLGQTYFIGKNPMDVRKAIIKYLMRMVPSRTKAALLRHTYYSLQALPHYIAVYDKIEMINNHFKQLHVT